MAIRLTEAFNDEYGRLLNYDANDVLENPRFLERQHLDLRSFQVAVVAEDMTMYGLYDPMSTLNLLDMGEMTSGSVIRDEAWTNGADGPDTALGGRNSLRFTELDLGDGIVTSSTTELIDISDVPDDWVFSMTLPNLPGSAVNSTQSHIRFRTDSSEGTQITFATGGITTTDGTQEFRVPKTALPDTFNRIDLTVSEGDVSGQPNKFVDLTDAFGDATINAAIWNTSGTVTETGGNAVLTTTAAGSTASLTSDFRYDLTASSLAAEVVQKPAGVEFRFELSQLSTLGFTITSAGQIRYEFVPNEGSSAVQSEAYNATNHRYMRIREAAGTIYWETSADGAAWTEKMTKLVSTVAAPINDYRAVFSAENLSGGTVATTTNIAQTIGTGTNPVSNPGPVTIATMRLIPPDWEPKALDIDTRNQVLRPAINPDGTYPSEQLPHIWRADPADPGGPGDPRPINSRMSVTFFTGAATGSNRIKLYFRGRREDFLTQLDLNGTDPGVIPAYGENMASLGARKRQPDYGLARYDPRPQQDLEGLQQGDATHIGTGYLQGRTQADLERLVDTISASWAYVDFQFGAVDQLTLGTTETQNDEERYTWGLSLDANSLYALFVDFEDTTLRVRVYAVDEYGAIIFDSPEFDSANVKNDFIFKRRKGRIGWEFQLGDGDAYIESVRSRGQMYGELLTNNFESFTPVTGARIYAGGTPDNTIIPHTSGFRGSTIEIDTRNARSTDGSVKVKSSAGQGFATDWIDFEDFFNTEIYFDIQLPTGTGVTAALLGEYGALIPLFLPTINPNRWQTVRLRLDPGTEQMSGLYKLIILQTSGSNTWWIDNLYVKEKSVAFAGRAEPYDPWNRGGNPWTEFRDLINSEINGVVFPSRGNWAQVRGQALKQGATIDKIYIKPQYAELGRMVWNT